jgi:hypothetical protein
VAHSSNYKLPSPQGSRKDQETPSPSQENAKLINVEMGNIARENRTIVCAIPTYQQHLARPSLAALDLFLDAEDVFTPSKIK